MYKMNTQKDQTTFTVTQQHINLLSKMVVEWSDIETGAPAINPKSPYGSSEVANDIADILDWNQADPDSEYRYSEEQLEKAIDLHRELETALQISLQHNGLETTTYVRDDMTYEWNKFNFDKEKEKEGPPNEQLQDTTQIETTDKEDQDGDAIKPVGPWVNLSPKNPIPEGKDNPIRIKLEDKTVYDGYNISGGFLTLDGLWVLADDGMDEIRSYRQLELNQ